MPELTAVPRKVMEHALRLGAQAPAPRAAMNWVYNRLTPAWKAQVHHRLCTMFRGRTARGTGAFEWRVRFLGKEIRLPVDAAQIWLHWDLALSLLGHDSEIKATYEALLRQPGKIRVAYDIGANYGLDSILLLSQGVRTLSFEPNPNCHPYLERVARLNGFATDIRAVALSEAPGTAELSFPPGETWLGTVRPEVEREISAGRDLQRIPVRVETLDGVVRETGLAPQLVKIDVEGSEIHVLRGARETLRRERPIVLFETNARAGRAELLALLGELGYGVAPLPLLDPAAARALSLEEFEAHRGTNFAAVPR